MGKKNKHRERFSLKQSLGIGAQKVLYGESKIHINCAGMLEIENCRKILSYNTQSLRLDMRECEVLIEGDHMVVGTYTKELITVRGQIFSVRFYEMGDTRK